ncbi:MAG TPA: MBL fold metallo-hydrolase [Candidatus Limnocylindria bacterium]|nr:MBL fold metallo-hydrolase [Candidatus Limnocylindria bacterium]
MLQIVAWRVPPYDNGCYLVIDGRREALVIDPSMGERVVMDAVRERGLTLVEILDTHGHPDHVFGNAAVKEATRARLAIHRLDAYRLGPRGRGPSSASAAGVSADDVSARPPVPFEVPPCEPDDLIEEGPLTYLADVELRALHTPGHTEGSTCFYLPAEGVLFSGDVLFQGNVGRVDLPGGDPAAMERSLARLAELPPETRVYPGHGPRTTIGAELRWLRSFRFA